MLLIREVIEHHDPSYDIKLCDVEKSREFYYFHSKKWCVKIVLSFYQQHTKKDHLYFSRNVFAI